MSDDLGKPLARMRVDGGAAANALLMQLQADLSNVAIERPAELESTARGAAMLAGVGAGVFASVAEAARMSPVERRFDVAMQADARAGHVRGWTDAVGRCRSR
jgi:glycerol kinase